MILHSSHVRDIQMYLSAALHLPFDDIVFDEATGVCLNIPYNKIIINELGIYISGITAPLESKSHLNNLHSLEAYLCDQANALVQRFFRQVVVKNPMQLDRIKHKPVVYLANHQTGIESLLMMQISYWLTQFPISALAKDKHKESSYGMILNISRMSDAEIHPIDLIFAKRDLVTDMLASFLEIGKMLDHNQRSILIHVEGTRALLAGQPIKKLSALNIDLAIQAGVPIIPVKFTGGLPRQNNAEKMEFPWNFGQQDCYFGEAIFPEELESKLLKDKIDYVTEKMNSLGPMPEKEYPLEYDETYQNLVLRIANRYQLSEIAAVFAIELQKLANKSDATKKLLKNITSFYKPEPFSDSRLELIAIELFGLDMSNEKDKPIAHKLYTN